MALQEELERTGNWLFRWRSFIPLALVVPMFAAMRHFEYLGHRHLYQEFWAFLCMGISFLGLAIRAAVVGQTPYGTSGRNTWQGQVADSLNTRGVYSVVRHPLYLGNFIIWLGISLFALTWWLTVIFALLYWIYYERIMFAEEAYLRRKFGKSFDDWAARTPAFLPRFSGWEKAELPFSLRNVLRREYTGFFGIVAGFFLLEVSEHVAVEHELNFEPHWMAIFLAGLTIYLTLRTLKKHTALLDVEGR